MWVVAADMNYSNHHEPSYIMPALVSHYFIFDYSLKLAL